VTERLAGRVAVITGGGSGIGLASARRLASEGATIVIGDVDETSGAQAAEEVGGLFVKVDVTDAGQVESMFQQAVDTYGSLDIAFNNAGISRPMTTPSSPPSSRRGNGPACQPDLGVPVLQVRPAAHVGQGKDPSSTRPRRRGDGRRHLADLLHRLEGRRAGDDA